MNIKSFGLVVPFPIIIEESGKFIGRHDTTLVRRFRKGDLIMSIAMSIYTRGSLQGVVLSVAGSISDDINLSKLKEAAGRLREIVGEETVRMTDRVFDEVLEHEVREILNVDDVEGRFPDLVMRFWARILLPLVELNEKLVRDINILGEVRKIEVEMGMALAEIIRNTGYRHAEELVRGLGALIDRDIWVIDCMSKYGAKEAINKLMKRGAIPLLDLMGYTMLLTFAWTAASAAVLGLVKEFKESNRDTLARWCGKYAEEIEGYIDTLDLLLDDEVYEDLKEIGIIKG